MTESNNKMIIPSFIIAGVLIGYFTYLTGKISQSDWLNPPRLLVLSLVGGLIYGTVIVTGWYGFSAYLSPYFRVGIPFYPLGVLALVVGTVTFGAGKLLTPSRVGDALLSGVFTAGFSFFSSLGMKVLIRKGPGGFTTIIIASLGCAFLLRVVVYLFKGV